MLNLLCIPWQGNKIAHFLCSVSKHKEIHKGKGVSLSQKSNNLEIGQFLPHISVNFNQIPSQFLAFLRCNLAK